MVAWEEDDSLFPIYTFHSSIGVTSSNLEVTTAERNITLIGHKHLPDSSYSVDGTFH